MCISGGFMHILWFVILFFFVTLKTKAAFNDNDPGEVIFVNILYRHGDRTPAEFYPNDPYQNKSYWPEGIGQLTNKGKQRVYELGQWLRTRYDSLLGPRYSPNLIYVQSSDKDRTLMSAEAALAGMFPPEGSQVWTDGLVWQPIAVHTTPLHLDKLLGQPPRTPCPAYDEELQRVFTTDEKVRKLNQTYAELLQTLNENTGREYSLLTLYGVYDALFVESLYNLTLPGWTKSVYPEPLREANVLNYLMETWDPKLTRLVTGPLLQDMVQNMVNKVNNKTTKNFHMYSGHDETITNILSALGAFNYILPPYASCLMMELRVNSGGKHFVSLYYRNSTSDGPYQVTVAGCAPDCPLDTFINITQPLIPEDWDEECSSGSGSGDQKHFSFFDIVLIVYAFVITALLLLVLYFRFR